MPFCRIKFFLVIIICLLFSFSLMSKEMQQAEQTAEKSYEAIVKSIKDKPAQAIEDLQKLADKNNSAAMKYLILLSIYQPQKINAPEFEEISAR